MFYYGPSPAFIDSGRFINDSTYLILKQKSSNFGDEEIRQDTFRLKPFRPKPDSINMFIK